MKKEDAASAAPTVATTLAASAPAAPAASAPAAPAASVPAAPAASAPAAPAASVPAAPAASAPSVPADQKAATWPIWVVAVVVAAFAAAVWFKPQATPPSAEEIATAVATAVPTPAPTPDEAVIATAVARAISKELKPLQEGQLISLEINKKLLDSIGELKVAPQPGEVPPSLAPAAETRQVEHPNKLPPKGVRFIGNPVVRPEASFWKWEKQGNLIFPIRKNPAGYPAPFMNQSRTAPPKGLFPDEPAGEWVIAEFVDPSGEFTMEGWAKKVPR